MPYKKPLRECFIKKHTGFKLNGKPSVCWLWKTINCAGYGTCSPGSHLGLGAAHRFMYKKFKGKLQTAYHIDHLCSIRNCVRPAHLEQVTKLENIKRRNSRNPHIQAWSRKFSDKEIIRIKALHSKGISFTKIGKRYEINSNAIRQICLGITYKHVKL